MKLILNVVKNYTNLGSFILLATSPRNVFEFTMFLFRYNVKTGFPLTGEIVSVFFFQPKLSLEYCKSLFCFSLKNKQSGKKCFRATFSFNFLG